MSVTGYSRALAVVPTLPRRLARAWPMGASRMRETAYPTGVKVPAVTASRRVRPLFSLRESTVEFAGPEAAATAPGPCEVRSLKIVTPSRDREDHADGEEMSGTLNGRKDGTGSVQSFPTAEIVTLPERQFADRIAGHLNGTGLSDKEIARIADAAPATVRKWRRGDNAPTAYHLLRTAAHIPALAGEVARLMGMEANLDPEFARDLNAFIKAAMRMRR